MRPVAQRRGPSRVTATLYTMAKDGPKRCTSTTKRGKPCKAQPLKGTSKCISHTDREAQERVGFGGSQPGAGRPAKPKAIDMLRERIEQDIDKWLAPFEESLQAGRGLVVGTGPNAWVETVPDYPTRLRAAAEALDRVYGRPAQSHNVVKTERSELDAEIEELLDRMAEPEPSVNGRR